MGAAGCFANCFFAAFDQCGVKWLWGNVPDAGPLHGAAFLFCELSTFILGLAINCGEHVGIEVALVEGCFATANNSSDDAGEGSGFTLVRVKP